MILYILMFSSVITLVLTLIQLYKDYRYDLTLIDSRFEQIEASNLASINESVWTLNQTSLNLQLNGLLRLPDMIFIEVRSSDNRVLSSVGDNHRKNTIVRLYPIEHSYREHKVVLGQLTAVATLDNVYQRLWDTAIVILVTQAIKTFLVSLFIVIIFQSLVTRHLGRFAIYLKKLNISAPYLPFSLDRKENLFTLRDELDQMVSSFNVMHKNLQQAYAELNLSKDALKTAQSMAHLGSWIWDMKSDQIDVSDSLSEMIGDDPARPRLLSFRELLSLVHPDDLAIFEGHIENSIHNPGMVNGIHRITLKNGSVKYIAHRSQQLQNTRGGTLLICTWHDITEDTLQKQNLEFLANYDSLTGLPNRSMFNTRLQAAIAKEQIFIMILIDLDGFKDINDSIGHIAGDRLLKELNPRISALLAEGDMLARLGGDEFALILRSPRDIHAGLLMVERVRQAISQPLEIEELQIQVQASAGVAYFPEHSRDASTLMRYADVAMYQAKTQHTGYQVYDAATDPHSPRKLALISDIRKAIRNNELCMYYQPKIDITSNRVVGLEALARWEHAHHGFILPADFIPYVERTELIRPFTLWAIEYALLHQLQLAKSGDDLLVSVNASARNLKDPNFASSVVDILQRHKIPALKLMLEITESAIMEDRKSVMKTILELAQAGVSLSIDDFGTGYSSLAYLKLLPVKELKIDRSFVTDMLVDENDAIIVKSTIDLAHNLGLQVTAEGVETEEMLKRLSYFNCDIAQGYLIASPMPFAALQKWLLERKQDNNLIE